MKVESLHDLLHHELKDLYSAEGQLVKALPKMAKAATSEALKAAFEEHLEQTNVQVERLDKISELLGKSLKGKKCAAMEGLIEEGSELIKDKKDFEPSLLDAALIGAAQKVEHYEIAGYGTARTFARLLQLEEVADLLQETLDEEGETDEKLTALAESEVNVEAASTTGDEK